jgi:NAD(P)H-hydrate epimerase
MIPTLDGPVPYVSTEQMREVDRAMIEDYHIELVQMMENAGRCLAHLARDYFLAGRPRGRKVVVLAGTGGNGGGALVAARRLRNYSADVSVAISKPGSEFTGVPAHQLDIIQRMGATVHLADAVAQAGEHADLIIDGIIGYSLLGPAHGGVANLIRWANAQAAPTLALDSPSGVDVTSGTAFPPTIKAAATMTLALPKHGLRVAATATYVGELFLADISVPPSLYARPPLGLEVGALFAAGDVVRMPPEGPVGAS